MHRVAGAIPARLLMACLATAAFGCSTDIADVSGADTLPGTTDVDVPGDAESDAKTDTEGPTDGADDVTPGDVAPPEDTPETPAEPPGLPAIENLPQAIACPEAPSTMAFPDDVEKLATSIYHFNVQYVAGGLDNYLGAYTATEEELEDAIIVESFEPLVALYERHPTWGGSFEMQGLMLEIMSERHGALLDRVRTLVRRGQVDVLSYHYSDQLVTAYPREHMVWSWDENQAIFDGLCMPRAPVHFLQEGQFGPGIQAFAAEFNELVVLPRNLMKFFHDPPPAGGWYENLGHATLTTDGQTMPGLQYIYTFVDDGELLATAGTNPYLPGLFKRNDKAVADYEAELTNLDAAGWVIAPISHLKKVLEARAIPRTKIDPPVLDGSWQPRNSDGMHLWMGGMGQEPGEERDNLVNTGNVVIGQRLLALQALWKKVSTTITDDRLGDVEAVLRSAKRELLLAEVSDATGWRPVHTEVAYGLRHAAEARRLIDETARHVLWFLEHRDGSVRVDPTTGEIVAASAPTTGAAMAAPPQGLEAVAVISERPHTVAWSDFGDYVELTVTHPATDQKTGGTVPPPRCSVSIPLATTEIAYSSAVAEDTLIRAPFLGYKVSNIAARLGLPLVNGLLEVAPNRTMVVDLSTMHLAALIDEGEVAFEDLTQPGLETAVWKIRFYDQPADAVLATANALNVHPVVEFVLD